ncbi:MAG: caspase family protein [Elusimicrobia bacterium]|nr:caspase family protein [Elusimicrobiota bacterium]
MRRRNLASWTLALTAGLGLSGCASVMGPSGHMAGSMAYVRAHKGEGLRRTIVGAEPAIMEAAYKSLDVGSTYTITREEHALLAKANNVDLAIGIFFYPSQTAGSTDVEILLASPWLKAADMQKFQETQFTALAQAGQTRTAQAPGAAAQAPAPAQTVPQAPAVASDVDSFGKRLPSRPDDFALIVGIERYETLPAADFGQRDAEVFRSYVLGLGVPEENVISLTGPKATKTGIAKYLEEWLPRNVTPESRVYFFYSGHGAPEPESGAAYLVPFDGDPTFLRTSGYPLPRLFEKLQALKAKEVVVALDSCFSGAGGRSVIAKGARPLVAAASLAPAGPKVSVLAASSSDEISGSLDEQGHGLFTYYLLKGLKGEADADKDGHVALEELHAFVQKAVQRAARRQNREQTPQLRSAKPGLRIY